MATVNSNRRNSLLAQLISVFKAVPESQLSDLADALDADARPGRDLFNSPLRHGNPTESESPTGSPEAASGDGAVKMVGRYADTTEQSALVEQYQQMARDLDAMRARVTDVEKALSATATAFAAMLGMSKTATIGKAEDDDAPGPVERRKRDETESEDDEDDDVEKSGIKSITVARLMDQIAGKAKRTTAAPPDFSMMKGRMDALDAGGEFDIHKANAAATLRMRSQAVAAGLASPDILRRPA